MGRLAQAVAPSVRTCARARSFYDEKLNHLIPEPNKKIASARENLRHAGSALWKQILLKIEPMQKMCTLQDEMCFKHKEESEIAAIA